MNTEDKGQKPKREPFRENVKDEVPRRSPADDVRKHVWDVVNTKPAPEPEKPDQSQKK